MAQPVVGIGRSEQKSGCRPPNPFRPRQADPRPGVAPGRGGPAQKRWSPEQISRALREESFDQPERYLVPETIYQTVCARSWVGLHREIPKALGAAASRGDERRGTLVGMTMLDQRPGGGG